MSKGKAPGADDIVIKRLLNARPITSLLLCVLLTVLFVCFNVVAKLHSQHIVDSSVQNISVFYQYYGNKYNVQV